MLNEKRKEKKRLLYLKSIGPILVEKMSDIDLCYQNNKIDMCAYP